MTQPITANERIGTYVMDHTERGECRCGQCIDRGDAPDPTGHSVDLIFFPVSARNEPDADTFRRLTREHKGEFTDVDPFDGQGHGYIALGAWIGDQGLAMQYMGLGALLGVFELIVPPAKLPHEIRLRLTSLMCVRVKPAMGLDTLDTPESSERPLANEQN